jgi:hypothetical protein
MHFHETRYIMHKCAVTSSGEERYRVLADPGNPSILSREGASSEITYADSTMIVERFAFQLRALGHHRARREPGCDLAADRREQPKVAA